MSFNLFPFLNVKGEKKHLKYLPNTYYIVFDNEKKSSNQGWTKKSMADSSDLEKKLMRLKKEGLKVEARNRNLAESGTKAELVRYLTFQSKLLLGSVINELYEIRKLKNEDSRKNGTGLSKSNESKLFQKKSTGIKKIKICLF